MLNEKFVNTWVLLRELPELIEGAKGASASRVARKLQQHYTDSVDILVLTPNAEVILHEPEMELSAKNRIQAYLTLLQQSLGQKRQKTELMEVLNVLYAPKNGYRDYKIVEIDTTLFERGGILSIEVQIGAGDATGSFYLFHGDTKLTIESFSDDALVATHEVPPRGARCLFHRFKRGQPFKLGIVGGWRSAKGSLNAFRASISVWQVPEEKEILGT